MLPQTVSEEVTGVGRIQRSLRFLRGVRVL